MAGCASKKACPGQSPTYPMKKNRSSFFQTPAIAFEGPQSTNALAFRHYNPDEVIDGRTLAEH